MSFKNDYKSAFLSVSPDTEKIIDEVHERLDENAPLKIKTEGKKKSVWRILAPVAGAAACIALCIIFIPKFFGLPLNNAGEMNNADNNEGAAPENFGSMPSGSISSESEFDLVFSDDGDITEVVTNGRRYFRTGTIRADEIPENYTLVIHVDWEDHGNTYYVTLHEIEDIIYVAEENSEWAYVFE